MPPLSRIDLYVHSTTILLYPPFFPLLPTYLLTIERERKKRKKECFPTETNDSYVTNIQRLYVTIYI